MDINFNKKSVSLKNLLVFLMCSILCLSFVACTIDERDLPPEEIISSLEDLIDERGLTIVYNDYNDTFFIFILGSYSLRNNLDRYASGKDEASDFFNDFIKHMKKFNGAIREALDKEGYKEAGIVISITDPNDRTGGLTMMEFVDGKSQKGVFENWKERRKY